MCCPQYISRFIYTWNKNYEVSYNRRVLWKNRTNCVIYFSGFRVEVAITTAIQGTWRKLI